MNWRDHESAIGRYLDGTMSPREREVFELRIAGDRELAGMVEAERVIRAAARTDRNRYISPTVTSDERFRTMVASLPAGSPGGARRRWLWMGGGGLAAIAIVALLVALMPRQSFRPETAAPAPAASPVGSQASPSTLDADTLRIDSVSIRPDAPPTMSSGRDLPASVDTPGTRTRSAARRQSTSTRPEPAQSETARVEIRMREPEIKRTP